MENPHLGFATTLAAVDTTKNDDASFQEFIRLPLELRLKIWHHILPDPEAERPALFSQGHSYTWGDEEGRIQQPRGRVPICMTTTCAALLHVNQESRHTVLSWARKQSYELLYRVYASTSIESMHLYDPDNEARFLPVQGPIFARSWDHRKDILNLHATADDEGPPAEWSEHYAAGEKLENVQHLAFSLSDFNLYMISYNAHWLLWILAATPGLKSLSLNCDYLVSNCEMFGLANVDVRAVGDPWKCEIDGAARPKRRCFVGEAPIVRWEAGECTPEAMEKFVKKNVTHRLMEAYSRLGCWPPKDASGSDSEGESDEQQSQVDGPPGIKISVLNQLPPWVWDRENGRFAFEIKPFQMMERRGYDDIRGGLLERARVLHGDTDREEPDSEDDSGQSAEDFFGLNF